MLTKKQLELLRFIHQRTQRDGVSPSFDEMKEALDLRSKSGIHRLITALEERGFIRRLAHRARAVEVIRLPEAMEPARQGFSPQGFSPRVIAGGARAREGDAAQGGPASGGAAPGVSGAGAAPAGRSVSARVEADPESATVVLVGRIAAGAPIEALEHRERGIGVPASMLSPGAEHFALEVRGDSMIEAGILDGDLVVIRRQDVADDGDIVVALIDDGEATLKRLRRQSRGRIALEAANPRYDTRILAADKVKIQGRLVGLVRSY